MAHLIDQRECESGIGYGNGHGMGGAPKRAANGSVASLLATIATGNYPKTASAGRAVAGSVEF